MSTRPPTKPAKPKLGRGRRPRAKPLREARDAAYRQHVVDTAERTFAEQGFADTRMQDIAAAASVSLAKLYQLYPSKEDLYRGVLLARDREMLGQFEQRWGRDLKAPASVEHVLLFMETHLRFLLEHADYLRLQLRDGFAWYSRAAQPTSEEQRMWERGVANISAVLGWGVRQGWFSPAEPRAQARMILAAQQTRLANWVIDGMRAPHEAVIAGIQADFVRLCCRPAVNASLLADDGGGLSPRARARLAELRG